MKVETKTTPAWNVFGVEAIPERKQVLLTFTKQELATLIKAQKILEDAEQRCLEHFGNGIAEKRYSLPDYGADELDDLLAMGAVRIRELLEWNDRGIVISD